MKRYFLIYFFSLGYASAQKTPLLLKSTITSVGSSSVTLNTGANTYFIQQSIGQSGSINLFTKNNITLQQGFLNNSYLITVKNPFSGLKTSLDFSIYPNPAIDFLTILFEKKPTKTIFIDLFDTSGKVIISEEYAPTDKITIPISSLVPATYILQIISGKNKGNQKLLKSN